MLRIATLATALAALALPAAAQQATPKVDWSKPVVGVDGLTQKVVVPADEILSVEVYTIEDLKRESGAASAAVIDVLQEQKEPPREFQSLCQLSFEEGSNVYLSATYLTDGMHGTALIDSSCADKTLRVDFADEFRNKYGEQLRVGYAPLIDPLLKFRVKVAGQLFLDNRGQAIRLFSLSEAVRIK